MFKKTLNNKIPEKVTSLNSSKIYCYWKNNSSVSIKQNQLLVNDCLQYADVFYHVLYVLPFHTSLSYNSDERLCLNIVLSLQKSLLLHRSWCMKVFVIA